MRREIRLIGMAAAKKITDGEAIKCEQEEEAAEEEEEWVHVGMPIE